MDIARTKRLMLAELFIFLTLAGTTAIAFQPIMALINKNIDVVRERILKQAEALLNRPIRYGSMGPSIIRTIDIRDICIGEKESPLVAADHFYLEYSLLDIIRGKGIGAVRSLVLESPDISFDPERDGDLKNLFSGKGTKLTMPLECNFSIRNGSVTFTQGKTALSVTGVLIEGEIREHWINFNGLWQKNLLPDGAITLDGSVQGSFYEDFNRGNAAVSITSIEGRSFYVEKIGLNLSFFEDKITFEREDDGLPLELRAVYLLNSGGFSGFFQADNFVPASMIHFKEPLERFSSVLSINLSGKAVVFYHGDRELGGKPENELTYNFALFGEGPLNARDSLVRNYIFEGNGNEKLLELSQFVIDAKQGSVRYTGDIQLSPLLADGTLTFTDFSLTGDASVNGALAFIRTDRGQLFNAPFLSFGETILSSFGGEIISKPGGGDYSIGFDCFSGGREGNGGTNRSSFECRGFFAQKPGSVEGVAILHNLKAGEGVNMARPFIEVSSGFVNAAQKTTITAEIDFMTDFKNIDYSTRYFNATYGSDADIYVSIAGNNNSLDLSNGIVQWRQGQVLFDFNAGFADPDDVNFRCSVSYLDLYDSFEGRIRNKNAFMLSSYQGFSASAINEDGQWTGSVSGRIIPIPFRGGRSFLNINTELFFSNANAWNVNLNRFEIMSYQGRTELLTQGQANQNGLNLDRIYYTDQTGPLLGSAVAIWNNDFSVIDASVFLADQYETEKIAGDIFYESGSMEFHGNITNFNGERITAAAKNMKFSGELRGGMSLEGYYMVNLSLSPLTGRIGQSNFAVTGLALLDPEKLILSQLHFAAGDMQGSIPFLSLDRNAGLLETEAQIIGVSKGHSLGLHLSMGLNFQPMKTWFDFDSFASLSGILDIPYAYINDHETKEPLNFVFTRTRSVLNQPITDSWDTERKSSAVYRISGGPLDMLNAEFLEESPGQGIFSVSLGNPFPVQGFISGFLDGTNVDALASEVFIDMERLWDLLPIVKVVNFTGGTITGQTRVSGSIFDPEFDGTAWGTGITLSIPEYIPVEIGPGSGLITLEGSGFYFGPVGAPCGNGHGILNASIRFNRWLLSYDLNIEVDREVPFKLNIDGVMVNGNAKGTLNLSSEEEELLTITGNLAASNTEITLNTEEIERAMSGTRERNEIDIAADILITTGKRVEFLWPNSRRPLLRAYGESVKGVQIIADTRVPMFSLDGNVSLRGGELYHISRSFYIREGLLEFRGTDLTPDPLISARAEIRDYNNEGPVTIFMIMEKIPLSAIMAKERNEFEQTLVRYESIPSLSSMEIYSFLGQAPPVGAAVTPDAFPVFLKSTGDLILQPVIFRPIEQRIRNTLGLDMFSLRTQILQNAVFETVRNRDPDEQPATMGNYLDNTAVFIGKYFAPDLFGQAMLAFRYDPYQTEYGGMRPELSLGLDLRTPLFDVRWNMGPLHLENLYLSDFVSSQSISVIWRWYL